ETIKACILESEAILGFVHAEAARSARARGKENIIVQNLLARDTFLFKKLKILHQVSDGEICRVALSVVAVFFARLKGGDVRNRQLFAAIAAPLKNRTNQVFVLPGESTKQNRGVRTLIGGERTLDGSVKVRGLIEAGDFAQAYAFCF